MTAGYFIVFLLIRAISLAVGIMAVWGLVDPNRFFGGRVYAGIGLFMAAELYVTSLVMKSL